MSLFSTLNTGVSGLKAHELAIATTGHNISNANNDYYTRQRVVMHASEPFHITPGDVGTGVRVTTIVRIHDEFVYTRLKDSSNSLSYDTFNKKSLEEIAKYFPDLEGVGLGVDIENYFASWNDLASNPDDAAQKIALVQNSVTLSNNLRESRTHVRALQDSINEQLKTNVDEINRIGEQLAELNKDIGRVEVLDTNRANDLRDQRDNLELTLAELVNVSVFKGDMVTENHVDPNLTDQGSGYHMNIAGHSFVDGFTFHPLVINNTDNASSYYSIYSKSQDSSTIEITEKLTGGKIGAMLDLRGRNIDPATNSGFPVDGVLQGYVDDLDVFAKTFVEQTNNIYARSAQERMSSFSNVDLEDNASLINYSESLSKGTFDVVMYDKQGNEVGRKTIDINSLTTMNDSTVSPSIVSQFNANSDDNGDNNSLNDIDDYFNAVYSYDDVSNSGILAFDSLDSLSGYTIAIEDNGTNFAGAIGLSPFLQGDDASNMDVILKYKEDPSKMNAYSAPIAGNNDVANDMVQMQYEKFDFYRIGNSEVTESIEGFYRFITTQIATDGESANRNYETSTALFNTINSEFQSISGVNVDEELTDLMRFQAGYGANAKVITTIDQMLDTLLGLKQ
ncbi:MAG TPA: flagellar hook-associated protein FlgK [Sulfurospirillum arcachonense]|nr:flagellar hook-associated protein FlgK [Sulfurospirillum arcachonense]HIP44318.1 flagellar hook-associated protein FlgK [Sulfurospirillum arcachonense]